jgi:hypothetical protein
LTFVKYQSSQEFGYDSELAQVAEVNYPIINVSGLSCITKINHMMNGLEKLLPIMGYINETLFERRNGRIAQLMKLSVQVMVVKALLNF